ncbi:MAG: hypothetical protein LKF88_04715 [Microbacteriaceae bacterium]|nr:hypothetical protein [Microbacteriaceae bacterium]MCI1207476.1 hypothetical protein [Microbacteriaceae bacterium]
MIRIHRRAALLSTLLAVFLLSGCASNAATPSATTESSPAVSTASPSPWNQQAGAAANRPLIDQTLRRLFHRDSLPKTDAVVSALTAVGIPLSALQVTPDHTPKGLAADMITVGVRVGKGCVLAQFNPDEYTSRIAQPVNGACLVGETAKIG